jgi:hypothetical protein
MFPLLSIKLLCLFVILTVLNFLAHRDVVHEKFSSKAVKTPNLAVDFLFISEHIYNLQNLVFPHFFCKHGAFSVALHTGV